MLNDSRNAMEQTMNSLRSLIVSGALLPGEHIRQQEVSDQLGVSRVPLREALNVLADQGLLLHRPNQGYYVAKRDPNELSQIRRMLDFLETELMARIEWPSKTLLLRLRALNLQMRRHVDSNDWNPVIEKNREFHFRIFELSPDRLILGEVQRLWTLADPYIAAKLSTLQARLNTVEEHEAILDALAAQDRAGAQEALQLHRHSAHALVGRA